MFSWRTFSEALLSHTDKQQVYLTSQIEINISLSPRLDRHLPMDYLAPLKFSPSLPLYVAACTVDGYSEAFISVKQFRKDKWKQPSWRTRTPLLLISSSTHKRAASPLLSTMVTKILIMSYIDLTSLPPTPPLSPSPHSRWLPSAACSSLSLSPSSFPNERRRYHLQAASLKCRPN